MLISILNNLSFFFIAMYIGTGYLYEKVYKEAGAITFGLSFTQPHGIKLVLQNTLVLEERPDGSVQRVV